MQLATFTLNEYHHRFGPLKRHRVDFLTAAIRTAYELGVDHSEARSESVGTTDYVTGGFVYNALHGLTGGVLGQGVILSAPRPHPSRHSNAPITDNSQSFPRK